MPAVGKRMQCADCQALWTLLSPIDGPCPECGAPLSVQVKLDLPRASSTDDPRRMHFERPMNKPA